MEMNPPFFLKTVSWINEVVEHLWSFVFFQQSSTVGSARCVNDFIRCIHQDCGKRKTSTTTKTTTNMTMLRLVFKENEKRKSHRTGLTSFVSARWRSKPHGSRGDDDDERCCSALWEGPCVTARPARLMAPSPAPSVCSGAPGWFCRRCDEREALH